MNMLKKWIKDVFTEPDNTTICIVRILAFVGFVYFLGAHAWSIFGAGGVFDLQAFGIAFSSMMATVGAALGIKSDSPKDGG